jgi:hypothetical protein
MPRKIQDGSIEQSKTNILDGWILNGAVRQANMWLTSGTTVVQWNGASLTFGGNIDLHVQRRDNGRYIIHNIGLADSPIAIADGEALVARIDWDATGNDTLVAGTYATLARGEYDVVAVASLSSFDASVAEHVVLFRRIGSTLHMPLNKAVWQTGTHSILGLTQYAGPGTASQVLTSNGSGLLPTYQDPTVFASTFGDGSDGNYVTGTTGTITGLITDANPDFTLLRDAHFENFTLTTGDTLHTNGFKLYVHGTLTLAGTGSIENDGVGGSDGLFGGTGGAGGVSGTMRGGAAGANGANTGAPGVGGASLAAPTAAGSTSGNGGAGSTGAGASGVGASVSASFRNTATGSLWGGWHEGSSTWRALSGGTGGASGGGGNAAGDRGGGGGGGGGCVLIFARDIVTSGWTGTISANGGDAGDGDSAGGGGGGGGGGGAVAIFYFTIDTPGNLVAGTDVLASGGALGTGGTGGANGTAGTDGSEVIINVSV